MKNLIKPYISLSFAFLVVLGIFFVTPSTAKAFDFLDPLGFFPGSDSSFGFPFPQPDLVGVPIPLPFPDFGGSGGCYDNCYGDNDYSYSAPLQVACYVSPNVIQEGQSATWTVTVTGGNGSYSYIWTGTGGLSGNSRQVTKTYNNAGIKIGSVTVTSGKKSVTQNCSGALQVVDYETQPEPTPQPQPTYPPINNVNNNYNYNYNNNDTNSNPTYPPYPYPNYPDYPDYPDYGGLSVSCAPTHTYVNAGTRVGWSAYASGGVGSYTYRWTGTDNLSESGQHVYKTYSNPGYKYATVTVRSGSKSVTQQCYSSVNVAGYYNYPTYPTYPTYPSYPVYQNQLDIACYADPAKARVNQPVNWTAEVTGGIAPYTYSWSGTDNLTGISNNVIKYYSAAGTKSAIVTIRSADGKTGTRACSNTIAVTSGTAVAKKPTPTPTPTPTCCILPPQYQPQQPQQPQVTYVMGPNGQPIPGYYNQNGQFIPMEQNVDRTGPLFSFSNIPWGLVSTLVILILFFTIVYLIFNRNKI